MTNNGTERPGPRQTEGAKRGRRRGGCLIALGVLFILLALYVLYPHLPFGRKIAPAELDTITISLRNGAQVQLDSALTARLVRSHTSEWYVLPIWLTHLNATAQLKNGGQCHLLMEFHSGAFVIEGQGIWYNPTGDSHEAWTHDVLPLLRAALKLPADNVTGIK